jgi:hypothetical protein
MLHDLAAQDSSTQLARRLRRSSPHATTSTLPSVAPYALTPKPRPIPKIAWFHATINTPLLKTLIYKEILQEAR